MRIRRQTGGSESDAVLLYMSLRNERHEPTAPHFLTRGFTLIELMIVVAVIAIIAAVAIPSLLDARIAANEASAISSIRTLRTAVEMYDARTGEFRCRPNPVE